MKKPILSIVFAVAGFTVFAASNTNVTTSSISSSNKPSMKAGEPLATAMPLVDIYNKFIAKFSDGNPAWKTDVTMGADVNKPPSPPYKLF